MQPQPETAVEDQENEAFTPAPAEPLYATYSEMPLAPGLQKALAEMGYDRPTPIQARFIPEALKGGDVAGQAQTGTGKTAAFILPILQRATEDNHPQALVLGPTRELIHQVRDEATRLSKHVPVKVAALYGGLHMRKQMAELAGGAQLIVGTPGRVLDLMRRGALRTQGIRTVVLDEADRMLDIGFRPDIEKILQRMPDDRQTLLLSATLPPPVQRLAKRYMTNPSRIDLSVSRVTVDTIEQHCFSVDQDRKFALLMHLLVREKPKQAVIFTRTKFGAEKLAKKLSERVRGVMDMRGNLPQEKRNRIMRDFREGKIRLLVATDVVGRGIDVTGISHVICYDVPEDPEAYVHRIGRTGRMGKDGKAFLLVSPDQGKLLTAIECYLNQQIPPDEIDGFPATRPRPKPKAAAKPMYFGPETPTS